MSIETGLMIVFFILGYLPYPFNIYFWIRLKRNGYENEDFPTLMSLLLFCMVPFFGWSFFLEARHYLYANEKNKKKQLLIEKEEKRKKYLAAYLKANGRSIEDYDEWIDSLSLIDKLINTAKEK